MKKTKTKLTKRMTIARTRAYDDSKNEDLKLQDEDIMNEGLQGPQNIR